MNKIFIFYLLFFSHFAAANDCYNGKIKIKRFNKYEEHHQKYCTNSNKTILISYNCRDKSCSGYKNWIHINKNSLFSEVGKPGFKLCRKLGGEPEIIQFLANSKWYKLDRCLFKSDSSFVDTGTLMKNYFNN